MPRTVTGTTQPRRRAATAPAGRERPVTVLLQEALDDLQRHASPATRDGLARFAIPTDKALGVSMANVQAIAKRLGRNHELAAALWATDIYEARMMAAYVDEPARVTAAQMDRWCRDFDNWALCDTLSFALFDRTPHAWRKVEQWAGRREEFVKRTAFALLWSLTRHDKQAGDEPFLRGLLLIEQAASDERNFVKKAVNMALRAIGRRNAALHAAAEAVAQRLARSLNATARWVGKDALRDLAKHAAGAGVN